ncbi:MAG: hypothetical protein ACKVP0_05295 [Pirellulaceae bacterium]
MSNVMNPPKPGQNQGQGGQRSGNQDGGSNLEKAKDAASGIGEKMQDAASYIGEKAKSATSSVMHSAEDAASYVGKKADDGVHAVGSTLKSFGDTVRHQAPGRDMLKDGMCAVADTLENTGKYLEEGGMSGIAEDMTNLIKRNPIPALFVGIGVGFLLARALSPRSH